MDYLDWHEWVGPFKEYMIWCSFHAETGAQERKGIKALHMHYFAVNSVEGKK